MATGRFQSFRSSSYPNHRMFAMELGANIARRQVFEVPSLSRAEAKQQTQASKEIGQDHFMFPLACRRSRRRGMSEANRGGDDHCAGGEGAQGERFTRMSNTECRMPNGEC